MNILDRPEIKIDHVSSQWLYLLSEADAKGKVIAVPPKYFNALKTWGMVDGTPGAARITEKARMALLVDQQKPKEKKSKKRK